MGRVVLPGEGGFASGNWRQENNMLTARNLLPGTLPQPPRVAPPPPPMAPPAPGMVDWTGPDPYPATVGAPAPGMVDWTGPDPYPATVGAPAVPEGQLPTGKPLPPPAFNPPPAPSPSPSPSPSPAPDTNIPTIFGSGSVGGGGGGGGGGVVPALNSLRSLAMRGNTDLNSALYGNGVGRSVPLMRNGGAMGFRPIGRMIG